MSATRSTRSASPNVSTASWAIRTASAALGASRPVPSASANVISRTPRWSTVSRGPLPSAPSTTPCGPGAAGRPPPSRTP
ncbi:hypothetical protein [Amycolatopsis sp. cmx-4-83]|uniref:hypothetical protein n=1 Tax=Amycolatopsis sp. cmx-4-83 TaxID=2790940 RepID=UPI00397AEEAB